MLGLKQKSELAMATKQQRKDPRMVRCTPESHGYMLRIAGERNLRIWEAVDLVIAWARRGQIEMDKLYTPAAHLEQEPKVEARHRPDGSYRCFKCNLWHAKGLKCKDYE